MPSKKKTRKKGGGFSPIRVGLWVAILAVAGVVAVLAVSTFSRHRVAEPVALTSEERFAFAIQVLNGNGRSGEARQVATALRGDGFRVELIGNAERFDYPRSLVIAHTVDRRRAEAVGAALGALPVVVQRREGDSDVSVILGHDWSPLAAWER